MSWLARLLAVAYCFLLISPVAAQTIGGAPPLPQPVQPTDKIFIFRDNVPVYSSTVDAMLNSSPTLLGVTPLSYGCVGDGVANDTACMQAAIGDAANRGLPLHFDSKHLFRVDPLFLTVPIDLEGPFRYGIWPVNQPTGSQPQKCPWGLLARNPAATLINAQAVTGTIRGLCIDMTGNDTAQATAGAAISLTPPDASHYASGWHVELNTILNPYDGIAIYGNGAVAACCGAGTAADGISLIRNTIVDPANDGISVGKNGAATSGGPGSVGITITDTAIVCGKNGTSRGHAGIALYEGAIWYDGTQNGPEGCNIGTLVSPGVLSGAIQGVELNADGVLGDQSVTHDFWVKPTGGAVTFITIGGKGPWAGATGAVNTVMVDCTNAATCQNITFTGAIFHGGTGNLPVVDIEAGPNGPFNLLITGSNICNTGNAGNAATGLKINIPSGATAGRFVISGNQIGNGCLGIGTTTGIQLILGTGLTGGEITITGNDLSEPAVPIAYTPNAGGGDFVIINDNNGLDDADPVITAAGSITLPTAGDRFFLSGTTTLSTINGAWRGRTFHLYGPANITTNTSGNICLNAVTNQSMVILSWNPGGTCWSHVP